MARRELRADSQNQAFLDKRDRYRTLVGNGLDAARLRRRLRCLPLSPLHQPPALQTNHGYELRRSVAEKWQDRIHLQSSGNANLCQRPVSPWRICALLVFAAACGATYEHLREALR